MSASAPRRVRASGFAATSCEPGRGGVVDQHRPQLGHDLVRRRVFDDFQRQRLPQRPLEGVDVRGVRPGVAREDFVEIALRADQQPVRVTQGVRPGVVARLERVVGVPRVHAVPKRARETRVGAVVGTGGVGDVKSAFAEPRRVRATSIRLGDAP